MRRSVTALLRGALGLVPARIGVSLHYLAYHGRRPDLARPRRFTEKIQARKLTDRDPRLPVMVDKIAVKSVVAERLGPDWVIPTLWSGQALPPRGARTWPLPFVLKSNNGSGTNLFVRGAADRDWPRLEANVAAWRPHAAWAREWAYSQVTPAVLVEPFIGDGRTLPLDYKIFVFGGRAHYIEVDTDRETGHKRTFFDRDWQRQSFALAYPVDPRPIARPADLSGLLAAAERLGEGFAFVRADFYEIDGRGRFGEMTFYPDGGIGRFDPDETDLQFGALWPSF